MHEIGAAFAALMAVVAVMLVTAHRLNRRKKRDHKSDP